MGATDTSDYITPALAEWRRRTSGPLLVVAIGTLPFLLLELVRDDLPVGDRRFLDAVNIAVLVVFAADYLVGLRLASNRRAYARAEWSSLLIVLAQAIAVIPAFAAFGAARALRGGRAVRGLAALFRIVAIGGASARGGRELLRRRAGTFALTLAGLTWLTSAVCFGLAEGIGEGEAVGSLFDALWWSAMTITTIGYGDIAPVTTAGRLVAMVTAVVGVASFAIVTARIAEFLVLPEPAGTPAPEQPEATTTAAGTESST